MLEESVETKKTVKNRNNYKKTIKFLKAYQIMKTDGEMQICLWKAHNTNNTIYSYTFVTIQFQSQRRDKLICKSAICALYFSVRLWTL